MLVAVTAPALVLLMGSHAARGQAVPSPEAAREVLVRTNIDPIRSKAMLKLEPARDLGATATTAIAIFSPSGFGASCWLLPASSWRPGFRSFNYNDRHLAASPVRHGRWQRGRLTLSLSAANPSRPLGYPLVRSAQPDLAIVLTNDTAAGEVRSCFLASPSNADIVKDAFGKTGLFLALDAVAPEACPTPPLDCTPAATVP